MIASAELDHERQQWTLCVHLSIGVISKPELLALGGGHVDSPNLLWRYACGKFSSATLLRSSTLSRYFGSKKERIQRYLTEGAGVAVGEEGASFGQTLTVFVVTC